VTCINLRIIFIIASRSRGEEEIGLRVKEIALIGRKIEKRNGTCQGKSVADGACPFQNYLQKHCLKFKITKVILFYYCL